MNISKSQSGRMRVLCASGLNLCSAYKKTYLANFFGGLLSNPRLLAPRQGGTRVWGPLYGIEMDFNVQGDSPKEGGKVPDIFFGKRDNTTALSRKKDQAMHYVEVQRKNPRNILMDGQGYRVAVDAASGTFKRKVAPSAASASAAPDFGALPCPAPVHLVYSEAGGREGQGFPSTGLAEGGGGPASQGDLPQQKAGHYDPVAEVWRISRTGSKKMITGDTATKMYRGYRLHHITLESQRLYGDGVLMDGNDRAAALYTSDPGLADYCQEYINGRTGTRVGRMFVPDEIRFNGEKLLASRAGYYMVPSVGLVYMHTGGGVTLVPRGREGVACRCGAVHSW